MIMLGTSLELITKAGKNNYKLNKNNILKN